MKGYIVHEGLVGVTLQVLSPEGRSVKDFDWDQRPEAERYAGLRSVQRFEGVDIVRQPIVAECFAAHRANDDRRRAAAQGQLIALEPVPWGVWTRQD